MPFTDSTHFYPHKFRSVKNFNDKHGLKVKLILLEKSGSAIYHSLFSLGQVGLTSLSLISFAKQAKIVVIPSLSVAMRTKYKGICSF